MSDPVLDLINKRGLAYAHSGKDYLIKCLNPTHEDSNPSFRVDKLTGAAHCFACGYKTNIFKHFGLTSNFVSIKVAKLKEKLKEVASMSKDLEFPCAVEPYLKQYRGISAETLKLFGAFYTYAEEKYSDRLYFPIKDISNRTCVFVGRSMHSAVEPRYMNVPSGVKIPIYPSVFQDRYSSAVLVEGVFDMLNLYDKGLKNSICTFGTNTLQKDTAAKLLPLRAQGINKIYLMFDGDEAGRTAMNTLQPLIEECGFFVEQIKLPDGSDPGELDQENVDMVRNYIEENSHN